MFRDRGDPVFTDETARAYISGLVDAYARSERTTAERVRQSGQSLFVRTFGRATGVTHDVQKLVNDFVPEAHYIQGIELAHYPDSARARSNGSSSSGYATHLAIATYIPDEQEFDKVLKTETDPEILRNLRTAQRINANSGWQDRIIPIDTRVAKVLVDPETTPIQAGLLDEKGIVDMRKSVGSSIVFKLVDPRPVSPRLVVSVANNLAVASRTGGTRVTIL